MTKWIRKQKYNRQIILVTHDANIVINGDAENVIIANHTADKFQYDYGALEYGDILDNAAIILDGGKIAIHRRISDIRRACGKCHETGGIFRIQWRPREGVDFL